MYSSNTIKQILKLAYIEYCNDLNKNIKLDTRLLQVDIDNLYKILLGDVIYPTKYQDSKQAITNAERLRSRELVEKEGEKSGIIKYYMNKPNVIKLLTKAEHIAKSLGLIDEFNKFKLKVDKIIKSYIHPHIFFISAPKDLRILLDLITNVASKTGWFAWIFAESHLYSMLKKDYLKWCKEINEKKIWDIGILNITKEEFYKKAISINEAIEGVPTGKSIITIDNYCYAFYKKEEYDTISDFPEIGRFMYGGDDNVSSVAFVNYEPLVGGLINEKNKYDAYLKRFKKIFDNIDLRNIILCEDGKIKDDKDVYYICKSFDELIKYIKTKKV